MIIKQKYKKDQMKKAHLNQKIIQIQQNHQVQKNQATVMKQNIAIALNQVHHQVNIITMMMMNMNMKITKKMMKMMIMKIMKKK